MNFPPEYAIFFVLKDKLQEFCGKMGESIRVSGNGKTDAWEKEFLKLFNILIKNISAPTLTLFCVSQNKIVWSGLTCVSAVHGFCRESIRHII